MKLSIIIPVYNEEGTIETLLKRVEKAKIPGVIKEIILVDDGSTDATHDSIEKFLSKKKNTYKFIKHKNNQGKGAAVRTGISEATGEYIVIQDADLEYDPNDIAKLLDPIKNGNAFIVFGTRLNRFPNFSRDENNPLFALHYLGNRFLSLVTSILYGQWVTDMETCYKVFPRSAVKKITLQAKGFEFEPEITSKLLKLGFKVKEISITTRPRDYSHGKKLNAFKEGPKALWTVIRYRLSS